MVTATQLMYDCYAQNHICMSFFKYTEQKTCTHCCTRFPIQRCKISICLHLLYLWNGILFIFIHFVCNHGFDCFVHAFIQVTKKDVRAALKTRLPFYMIPSHFVFLARFVYYTSLKTSKKICCINAI